MKDQQKPLHLPSIQKSKRHYLCLLSLLNAPHKVNLPPGSRKQSSRRASHLSNLNDQTVQRVPCNGPHHQRTRSIALRLSDTTGLPCPPPCSCGRLSPSQVSREIGPVCHEVRQTWTQDNATGWLHGWNRDKGHGH